jgi:hypothetical protein
VEYLNALLSVCNNMIYENRFLFVLLFLIGALIVSTHAANAQQQTTTGAQKNIVRDSEAILLEGKTIPSKDYIHLYDSTPYMIFNGHIAAKLPCDTNSISPLKVLIGQAPNLKPAQLEYVKPLSTPGKLCIYHVDVNSTPGNPITDIAIQNPTGNMMTLPSTSTVVIGVNEISPLSSSSSSAHGNMTK